MLTRLLTALAAALLLSSLVCATVVGATRPPTEAEVAGLTEATNRSPRVNHNIEFVISEPEVSASGRWAMAILESPSAGVQPGPVVYERKPAPRWTLVFAGSELCVGPTLSKLGMPRSVQAEFGLEPCPKTDRRVRVRRSIVGVQFVYRPHALELSGDGTFSIRQIHWLSYGGRVATARGRAYAKGCEPSCATAPVVKSTATLRLSHLIDCNGVRTYARLHYVLRGPVPPGYRHHGSYSLRPTNFAGEPEC